MSLRHKLYIKDYTLTRRKEEIKNARKLIPSKFYGDYILLLCKDTDFAVKY
jgi:hypothetical protein